MSQHDDFVITGDFYSGTSETVMSNFCDTYHLHNLVKDPYAIKV